MINRMTIRRISRGTPAMLTPSEQENYIKQLENYPGLTDAVETILGVSLAALTYQQKVKALHEYLEIGRASSAFAAATRSITDLAKQAQQVRREVDQADELALAKARVSQLEERLAALTPPTPAKASTRSK